MIDSNGVAEEEVVLTEDIIDALFLKEEELFTRESREPHIWGYVRMSSVQQEKSPVVQADLIKSFAATLDGHFAGLRLDSAVSAKKVLFSDRREARALMNDLLPGDSLIVCKLDRLGRGIIDIYKTLDKLMRMNINVYILNFGGGRLDLVSAVGKAIVGMMSVIAELESNLISERTKEALAYRKTMGLVSHSLPKYGFIRKRKAPKPGQIKGDAYYERHPAECQSIKEIYNRYREGNGNESMPDIFRDFMARGVKKANGEVWARHPTSLKDQLPSINRFYKVFEFYKNEFVLKGKEL